MVLKMFRAPVSAIAIDLNSLRTVCHFLRLVCCWMWGIDTRISERHNKSRCVHNPSEDQFNCVPGTGAGSELLKQDWLMPSGGSDGVRG